MNNTITFAAFGAFTYASVIADHHQGYGYIAQKEGDTWILKYGPRLDRADKFSGPFVVVSTFPHGCFDDLAEALAKMARTHQDNLQKADQAAADRRLAAEAEEKRREQVLDLVVAMRADLADIGNDPISLATNADRLLAIHAHWLHLRELLDLVEEAKTEQEQEFEDKLEEKQERLAELEDQHCEWGRDLENAVDELQDIARSIANHG